MRIGKCIATLGAITITLMLGLGGCQGEEQATTKPAMMEASPGAMSLCDGCGYEKGTDMCCAEGMEKCDGCGKAKGSPGCCK